MAFAQVFLASSFVLVVHSNSPTTSTRMDSAIAFRDCRIAGRRYTTLQPLGTVGKIYHEVVTRGKIKKAGNACQKAPDRLNAKRGPATAAFWPLRCQCLGYSFSIQAPPIPARCTAGWFMFSAWGIESSLISPYGQTSKRDPSLSVSFKYRFLASARGPSS